MFEPVYRSVRAIAPPVQPLVLAGPDVVMHAVFVTCRLHGGRSPHSTEAEQVLLTEIGFPSMSVPHSPESGLILAFTVSVSLSGASSPQVRSMVHNVMFVDAPANSTKGTGITQPCAWS